MKAQYKYLFKGGLYARGPVFAVILLIDIIFIVLGALGLLPLAARIVAVSLGGWGIVVMFIINIIDDVGIFRNMVSAPDAYLRALTPAPRRNALLAGVTAMLAMDTVTLAAVIIGEVWMGMNLAGQGMFSMISSQLASVGAVSGIIYYAFHTFLSWAAGYLLIMMLIMFFITVKKSRLYDKKAGGILIVLLIIVTLYIISLLPLVLAPFGHVIRFGMFVTIILNDVGAALLTLLMFAESAALFAITSKLMEKELNI